MLQGKRKTDITEFLRLAEEIPVADVRSPSEFNTGHIPGAFNIPLFDDAERAEVGTRYKKEGRLKAVIEGIRLSGPSMYSKLEQALRISVDGRLLVHCWRGGMRSEAMAWLFSLGDIDTEILDGGYKSYRHYLLRSLSENRKMIILGGLTGSGKTRILDHLAKSGMNIIDLEGIANHKGSAFGALGQPPQPTSEHFSNLLFEQWKKVDRNKAVWLEDESRNIGSVFMHEPFYLNMQKNPTIVLIMDVATRLPRLLEEYSCHSPEDLTASVLKISKRLGGEKTKEAIEAVQKSDFAKAIEISLQYYDRAYLYGLKRKETNKIIYIKTDTDDIAINAAKVLEAAEQFM
jgi:tRNA 2-selenouridine synthase